MTGTGPAAAARAAMPERYGRPRRGGRTAVVAVSVLVAVAGLTWLVWAATSSTQGVAAEVRGYKVVSGARTEVTLEVRRRETGAVRCEVYAQAEDTTIVGERTVTLASAGPGTVTTTVRIATERRATTAVLRECALV
jgi:hypothetical protein